MTAPSSFNVTGLLGGIAGSIDTTQLVSQLVQAAALPQTNLKNQLAIQQSIVSAYQGVSSKLTAMQTAAQALTDQTAWLATAATSSSSSVVASSTSSAQTGSTTFDVLKLAAAQISTVAADSSGNVIGTPASGLTITGSDNVAHQIVPVSGSAADVASAINSANVGVRATVVNTDTGTVLQLAATSTGSAGAFTATGFTNPAQTVVSAQDAQIGVGSGPGSYTVSSATNTFTGVIPGVTFTVSAPATGVTISVSNDEKSISDKVQALVDAANASSQQITSTSTNGAILQGNLDVQTIQGQISSAVSNGTLTGGTLHTYGIDIDKNGQLSFDAAAFAQAYAADPAGTKSAISASFATALNGAASQGIDPVSGSITNAVKSANDQETKLNSAITSWNDRLALIQQNLQAKFTAMETALAKLQSQQTYLNSALKSINGSSSTSGSGSN